MVLILLGHCDELQQLLQTATSSDRALVLYGTRPPVTPLPGLSHFHLLKHRNAHMVSVRPVPIRGWGFLKDMHARHAMPWHAYFGGPNKFNVGHCVEMKLD